MAQAGPTEPLEETLSPRRRAFVDAYTNPDSPTFGNGTQSVIAAGYSDHPVGARVQAHHLLTSPNGVASPVRAAFEAQGVNDHWRANLLKRYAEDGDASWKRAPAVRAIELTARIDGTLRDDVTVNVDARSALLPVSVPPEALLALLQQAASSE
jgi:hypothetical protein